MAFSLSTHLQLANLPEPSTVPCPPLSQLSHVACAYRRALGQTFRGQEARCMLLGGHPLLPGLPGDTVLYGSAGEDPGMARGCGQRQSRILVVQL